MRMMFAIRGAMVLVVFGWLAVAAPQVGASDLVRDGQALSIIVIPDAPLPVVAFAAEELQYHITAATGATLDILRESDVPDGAETRVWLGPCNHTLEQGITAEELAPNAFHIKRVGDDLCLIGKDSDGPVLDSNGIKGRLHNNRTQVGTLFAVYELLENHMGVRWLWPGELGEIIPARDTLEMPDWDRLHTPRLLVSRLRDYAARNGPGWSSPEARERFFIDQATWMRRHRFAQGMDLDYGHAFVEYWERFGQAHPEYFALRPDGKREPAGQVQHVQMCVSEPGLWTTIVEDWRRRGDPWINGAENDYHSGPNGDPACTCKNCLAWDASNSDSMSDRYAKFWLALQDEAQKQTPEVTVIGYAYGRSNEPPIETKLNDRIVIGIVPQFYFPWTNQARQSFRDQWEGWSEAGVRLFLRPNYFLDGHNFPIYFADAFGEDFSFAAERGMIATDFDSITGQWATQGPNLYMLGRKHVRPEMSEDEVLDEYYAAFGTAEDAVRAYFDHWKQVSNGLTAQRYDGLWKRRGITDNPEHRLYRWGDAIFTPLVMMRGRERLNEAVLRASGDPVAERRVSFLDKGLRNAELTLHTARAYRHAQETSDDGPYLEAVQALDAFRRSVDEEGVANMGNLEAKESVTGVWSRDRLEK